MRVLLVNPPTNYYTGTVLRLNPTLSLPYISAMLTRGGHRCAVIDMEALGMSPRDVSSVLAHFSSYPDAIGFTALSVSQRGCRETIAQFRNQGYNGRILVGGVYASLFPDEVAGWEGVNTVVTGECEGNVVSIFEQEKDGIIAGIPLPSLADLPLPQWATHIPLFDHYWGNPPFLHHPEAICMMTRGCPHRCSFCSNPIFHHQRQRFRPPESIRDEFVLLQKMGIKSLFVYDDELAGVRIPAGWLNELETMLAPIKMVWKCQGRCSDKYVTPKTMKQFYNMGCRAIMWGIESFSQKVLNNVKKDMRVEEIWSTLRISKDAGIKNWAFTMLGNYGETEQDAILTLEGLKQAYEEGLIDFRQTTVTTALPGTKLYELQKKEGWYHAPPEYGPVMYQTYQDTPWLSAAQINYYLRAFESVCPSQRKEY